MTNTFINQISQKNTEEQALVSQHIQTNETITSLQKQSKYPFQLSEEDKKRKILPDLLNSDTQNMNQLAIHCQEIFNKRKINKFEFPIQLGRYQVIINLSQKQRQDLLNLIQNKNVSQIKMRLIQLAVKQSNRNQNKSPSQSEQQNLNIFDTSLDLKKEKIVGKKLINQLLGGGNCCFKSKNTNQDDDYDDEDDNNNSNSNQNNSTQYQLSDKLLGGGNSCSGINKVTPNEPVYSSHQRMQNPPQQMDKSPQQMEKPLQQLDESNVNKISNLKQDTYFQEEQSKPKKKEQPQVSGVQSKVSKRDTFHSKYELYFTNEEVDEDEIETHIYDIIKETLHHFRRNVVSQEIRQQVIDLINLIINYSIIIVQKQEQQSLQADIDKQEKKLQKLQQYCKENRKKYPCLDLYQYMSILIALNSQRKGLDVANQSVLYQILQKIVQVAKFGAGFVSIAGAIQNLTEINIGQLQQFLKEVKNIYTKIIESNLIPLVTNSVDSYYRGSLTEQICSLWLRKIEVLGENLLDPIQEIIFYLEEKEKLKNDQIILFVYMQLNYLLLRQQEYDNFKQFTTKLVQGNKKGLIMDFANELQLKQYQKSVIEKLKTLANLIVLSEQFRYIKASLQLKMAQIIKIFGEEKSPEYQSIMTDLCLNYIEEKEISVKIVYRGDPLMKEFINNVDKYYKKIVEESKKLKNQLEKFIDDEEDKKKIGEISNSIKSEEDIPKLLAINFVEMWEVGVKQRMDSHQIAHKDDALLEAINLYIEQTISYLDGQNLVRSENDNDGDKKKPINDALNQIIQNFLIPNFVSSQSKEQKSDTSCKILSILAEGGSGKSMLLKKLEVELLKDNSEYIKNERAQYIPLIIKCNSLDIKNPSIEQYLVSQNLEKSDIEILKTSEKNKIIMLDGYDEYTGDYFNVYKELKIYDWVNTIVIVTSRLEKISVSDAKLYFSYCDKEGVQGNYDSFSVVKLEKISQNDISEYLEKYKQFMNDSKNQFNQSDYNIATDIIMSNYNMIQLLKLPINLYLTTRMMTDLNLQDENVKDIFENATDQIEIQELFFSQNFQKQAAQFVQENSQSKQNSKQKQELIQQVKSTYFEYFQNVAMQMFLSKGKQSNFLSAKKESIKFELRQETQQILKKNKIEMQLLYDNIINYVDSRVITRVKLSLEGEKSQSSQNTDDQQHTNAENNQEVEDQEFEFRHKSIFEYFTARGMKFDFDIHKENVYILSLEQLEKFNINQASIMNVGFNNSEQQILLKLYKLIDYDKTDVDYTKNYTSEDIENNNRYIQYIKRSKIEKFNETSSIDTGSSNLLSALFISKFSFQHLTLRLCSISKFYNQYPKINDINFEQCNLKNALLKNIHKSSVESSYTEQAIFDSVQEIFSTDNQYGFSSFVFEENTLITVNRQGFINTFKISKNSQYLSLEKSKKLSSSSIQDIRIYSQNQIIVITEYTLFLINIKDLEVQQIHKFKAQILNLDTQNGLIIVQLNNDESYFGNFQNDFKQINVKGKKALLSNNCDLLITSQYNELVIYNQDSQEFTESKTFEAHEEEITSIALSSDGKYLATGSKDYSIKIWNIQNEFELHKSIQEDHTDTVVQVTFSSDGKYLATGSEDNTSKIYQVENEFELVKSIESHQDWVTSVRFSQDCKYLATCSYDNNCLVWSTEGEIELINQTLTHTKLVNSVAFSSNGKYLATASGDSTCKLWEADKGYGLIQTLHGHTGELLSVAFSANGKFLATVSEDKTCKLWDIEKGFQLIKTIEDHEERVTSVEISSNVKYLVTGSEDTTCRVYSVEKGFKLIKILEGHTKSILTVALSADGKYLATGSEDQTFKIWNQEKGFELIRTIKEHTQSVSSVSFSSNGKYLATGSNDNTCNVWSIERDFQLVKTLEHQGWITSTMFSPNCKYLATSETEKSCRIWDIEKGFQLVNTITYVETMYSIAFSANSRYLAIGFSDRICKVYDVVKGFELTNPVLGNTALLTSVTFSENGKYMVTGSYDSTFSVWNAEKGFEMIGTIQSHTKSVRSVAISKDGRFLATGSEDYTCKIWDIDRGFELVYTIETKGFIVDSVAFSSDGKYLAFGSGDQSCKIWKIEDSEYEQAYSLEGHTSKVTSVSFSADCKYLATASEDNTCKIWNVENEFALEKTIEDHTSYVVSVAFSPDGQYLATCSFDSTCKVWNVNQEFELVKTLEGHTDWVNCASFSPDGQFLITCSQDFVHKVWEIENEFELINTIIGHTDRITSVAFHPNSKSFATVSYDTSCKIWKIEEDIGDSKITNGIKKQKTQNQILEIKQFDCVYVI